MGLPSRAFCSPQQWAEAGASLHALEREWGLGEGRVGQCRSTLRGVDRRQSGLGRGVTQRKEQQLLG